MQKARLTIDCIKKFNPSKEKPLLVSCDDGYYSSNCSVLKIIGWNETEFIFKDMDGTTKIWTHRALEHFPSPYQPVRKYKVLFYKKGNSSPLISSGWYKDKEDFKAATIDESVFIQMLEEDFKDE